MVGISSYKIQIGIRIENIFYTCKSCVKTEEYDANTVMISYVSTGISPSHDISISPSNLSSLKVLLNRLFINFNFETASSIEALVTGSVSIIVKAI